MFISRPDGILKSHWNNGTLYKCIIFKSYWNNTRVYMYKTTLNNWSKGLTSIGWGKPTIWLNMFDVDWFWESQLYDWTCLTSTDLGKPTIWLNMFDVDWFGKGNYIIEHVWRRLTGESNQCILYFKKFICRLLLKLILTREQYR